ncbi:hypothetical protein [Desertivirga arenae]|uniref:hypothetical protein n=1 Tax=Desertivirga arenae TaxID=2810309 RepID=UPI001A95DF5E|nr:hypothetical protein [Pedobacter sp. SYSU D00823]
MKNSINNISPFIILLIPVLLVVALLAFNPINNEEAEQMQAVTSCNLPQLKSVVQVVFSIK